MGKLPWPPAPDFAELERVIRGEERPQRVHLVELLIDEEVMRCISESYLGMPWAPLTEDTLEPYYKQLVELYYRLGYDCVNVLPGFVNHPKAPARHGEDTAGLSRGQRRWVEEDQGLISSWQDFERFPWEEIKADYRSTELVARNLPDGMKVTVMGTVFQHVVFDLFGTSRFLTMLYDEPDLVAAVFERWGQVVYDLYASIVDEEDVGAIWHADDVGFTTSTLVSPQTLRQFLLPWISKYAALAHDHGKTFWLHCCGNVYATGIIRDLIEDVHLDAFHSFQDPILPVVEFQKQYGDRLAALGGVDMDKLCRMEEEPLRAYMRDILDQCIPKGRFIFGTGNTVTNYTPIEHYLWMLDESRRMMA